jgi:hypothetical protein
VRVWTDDLDVIDSTGHAAECTTRSRATHR